MNFGRLAQLVRALALQARGHRFGSYIAHHFFAGIAQLVEQLTCNQQVVGSSPISGTIYLEGQRRGQTRQTVNLFLRVRWFKSISLHQEVASQPSGKASDFDSDMRQFESSRGSHSYLFLFYVPLAQLVEHLTFNQRVMRSSRIRDTTLCLSGGIGRRTGLKILRESNPVSVQVRPQAPYYIRYSFQSKNKNELISSFLCILKISDKYIKNYNFFVDFYIFIML